MLPRVVIALILSAIGTIILFFGSAAMDGMCHCMKSMYTVFPYGSYVMMHYSSDTWGLPLTLIQFPAYVLAVMFVKGIRWKLGVALLLIVLHVAAASFALHDYCQSRRTCFLRRQHATRTAMRFVVHPVRGVMFIADGACDRNALL